MAVSVNITNQKYYNQYNNGVDFTNNLSNFTVNLTGSVMEKVKIVFQVDINWGIIYASQTFMWDLTTVGTVLTIVSNNGVNFRDEGFSSGDVTDLAINVGGIPIGIANVVVDSVNANTMIMILPAAFAVPAGIIGIRIEAKSNLTALKYTFGLIENAENFNVESKVSLNDQGYYASGIGSGSPRSTSFVNMTKLGNFKDWQTGSMKARYISNPSTYVQRFEIEHEFIITPFYLEGELSNLQNNIIPPLLNGLNSLKYVFSPGFRTVLSNPNSEKKYQISQLLGSVAWYNESFNGFNSNYEVTNVSYQEALSGNNADGILITSKTQVTIDVKNLNSLWTSGGERAGVYLSYLPEQIEYTDTILTDLKQNFLYDNALNNEGSSAVNGENNIISNFRIIPIDDDELRLIFDVEYTLAEKLRLSSLNSQSPINYLIGVQLGDATLPAGNSDRLILLADVKNYDESADIPNLLNFTKFDILTHEKQLGVLGGTTDVTAWNEDGVLVDYTFNLDLNKQAVLNSLDFLLIAYDPSTKKYFELDKYSYNIFPSIVSGGIQQLILNATRGYILKLGDQFNDVTLGVGTNTANVQDYNGLIGQKFSWQDWIENLGVDTIFFDPTKPNNNFNLKSSNYSFLNGYEIRLAFLGNLFGTSDLGVSGLTDYLTLTPPLIVYDYKKDGNATPIWSETIETFDVAGTNNLNGAILTGQDTLLRSTWVNSLGAVTTLVGLWGINRIEETNQIGFSITEISTINLPGSNQLLKPKNGLTLCDIQIVGGNVVLECLIDGNVAQSGVNYNLSTRIQDNNFVILGKQTETGAFKDTETSVIKVVE